MAVIQDIQANGNEVCAEIRVSGRIHRVRFASDDHSLQPAPEAFLLLALPAAMHTGEPLRMDIPVSGRLLAQLPAVQALYREWSGSLRTVEIQVPARGDEDSPDAREGLFFTGGVDSFYSALQLPNADLVFIHGLDIPLEQSHLRGITSQRLGEAASQLGRNFVELETDLREFSDRFLSWQLSFGGALAACGYLLSRQFNRLAIAASYGEGDEVRAGHALPDGSHPELVPQLSSGAMQFRSVGLRARRIEKLQVLAESPAGRQALRVCWENRGGAYNCGACEKCLRTMAALQALGILDQFSCFERHLDYRRLARAVSLNSSTAVFLDENLQAAIAHGAEQELIDALRAATDSPMAWFWHLYGKIMPRRCKDWIYRAERRLAPDKAA